MKTFKNNIKNVKKNIMTDRETINFFFGKSPDHFLFLYLIILEKKYTCLIFQDSVNNYPKV